ncbi:MAG: Y-family DNA polymerase [Betaproteobacteria bacterium]
MSLWLAVALPALPLQLATRALDTLAQSMPVAVIDGPAQRPLVACCNAAAQAAGVAPGLKLAAAQALAQDLVALRRNPAHEGEALQELAAWAYQFSAQVTPLDEPGGTQGLLLEIGGSLSLFGGRHRLTQLLRRDLAQLGYHAELGAAPTPRGAWLIAVARSRGTQVADALSTTELAATLKRLPLPLAQSLGLDEATRHALQSLGLRRLGDLLALPRAELQQRFGPRLFDGLDRALGRKPDPQPPFEPPAQFVAGIELPADLTDAEQLMFPARRLLASLEGFLRGRNAGATALVFSARHSPRRTLPTPPTEIALKLAAPERDAQRLARLLAERLTRVQLPEPAIALRLAVERLQPFAAVNNSLLPPAPDETGPGGAGHDWLQLAETLHARLGSERVFQLQVVDDHRPEHASRAVPLAVHAQQGTALPPARPAAPRPLLLLPAPRPLRATAEQPSYDGPLTLVTGPERIEAGWWDFDSLAAGKPRQAVHRDYFVARNPQGQLLWIFRELTAPRGWFLHGFFA